MTILLGSAHNILLVDTSAVQFAAHKEDSCFLYTFTRADRPEGHGKSGRDCTWKLLNGKHLLSEPDSLI